MNKLEPSKKVMRKMIENVSAYLMEYYENVDNHADRSEEGLKRVLREMKPNHAAPEEPSATFEEITEKLFSETIPLSLNTAGGGNLAYIPGGGLFESALADFITEGTNRYVGVNFSAPLLSQMEAEAIGWLCTMVGYDEKARGIFTTGGSIANLTALITGRSVKLDPEIGKGVIYGSEQTHHSVWKAAFAAGIMRHQVKIIPVDQFGRMDIDKLKDEMKKDKADGLTPFFIVANGGTTDTGTVDPIEELCEIAKENDCWFHVDGAYGGFFTMTERGKKALKGISKADSITLDPHKGLFLPYGTGTLLIKNGHHLRNAFTHQAPYITETVESDNLWDFSGMSLELSRAARGIRVWIPMKLYGMKVFRQYLDEKLDLTQELYEKLSADSRWEVMKKPDLSLVVFRFNDPSKSDEELNKINAKLMKNVNKKGRVHLSGTTVDGKFVIRVCVLSFRTHAHHMENLLEDLLEASEG